MTGLWITLIEPGICSLFFEGKFQYVIRHYSSNKSTIVTLVLLIYLTTHLLRPTPPNLNQVKHVREHVGSAGFHNLFTFMTDNTEYEIDFINLF